jgi:EAL domain-containing protein (putative c-di-GMP-specific phosphodiesterase class I)
VLEQACRQPRIWQQEFLSLPPVVTSVNLSGGQFRQLSLVADVSRALAAGPILIRGCWAKT